MAGAMLAFHITDRCQLNCQHCLRDPAQKPRDLDVEVMIRVLDQAVATYGIRHVALTGGEPTLHPRFFDIVDAIAERGCRFHFVTNGKRSPTVLAELERVPARRAALSAVDFSLDGPDEETHDLIRGEGSFRDVMGGVSICAAHDIPFVLQMTIHALNEVHIESVGMLAAQLGASCLSLNMTQPTGTELDERMYLSPHQWHRIEDRITRLREVLKLPINQPEGFSKVQPFHVCEPFQSRVLHVDLKGRLTLCCQHSGVPGDGSEREVAGDLGVLPLVDAHRRLLDIIHEAQQDRLARVAEGGLSEWEHFPCNACMRSFGKPHWTDDGVGGPGARRERWRGAWAKENVLARGALKVLS